jgi:phosphatidylglycerol---prolipoprotein diacylglyceryl transferase
MAVLATGDLAMNWANYLAEFTSPGTFVPFLPKVGPLAVRWYGFLIALAVVLGLAVSQNLARRRRVDPELLSDLVLWLVIAAIPAARLYFVLFHWPSYQGDLGQIFQVWNGGIAIHGAILGGLVAMVLFAKRRRVSFWQLTDLVAPALVLGQAIGRWGNFFNSEVFGAPTDLPWKLYIPEFIVEDGVKIVRRPPGLEQVAYYHPTFLYESLWNLAVFGLLIALFAWGQRTGKLKLGTLLFVYLIGYSCGRFWIEGLRLDSLMLGGLKMAQVMSFVEIWLGGMGLIWLYGLRRSLPDVVEQ